VRGEGSGSPPLSPSPPPSPIKGEGAGDFNRALRSQDFEIVKKRGADVETVFMVLFLVTAVLITLLVLIQRGRGSGLVGAFGGPGGHSAFGTKTADVLIKITAVLGAVFFLLAIVTAWFIRPEETVPREKPAAEAPAPSGTGEAAPTAPAPPATVPSEKAPAESRPVGSGAK